MADSPVPAVASWGARLDIRQRLTESAWSRDGAHLTTLDLHRWLADRRAAGSFEVRRVPFSAMPEWCFQPGTGNLVHRSGRFFAIEGVRVRTDLGPVQEWTQPIIRQPEIGILGILVKEFGGVLHCLMQAKMEPGNVNILQLSPTVQATRSNYTRVHRGRPIPYLEHFVEASREDVHVDVLQSEQGSWFHQKRNRNLVVEVTGDVPVGDDFCWLTLGQVHELMRVDNLVNMDSRTVLSCLPYGGPGPLRRLSAAGAPGFREALARSFLPSHQGGRPAREVVGWLTDIKSRHVADVEQIPLRAVQGWHRTDSDIRHADGSYFSVVGVSVRADSREVGSWTQPMIAPAGQGTVGLLVRRQGGVVELLVQARAEAGCRDMAELAPSVQCVRQNYTHLPAERQPRFLDRVDRCPATAVRYDTVQSEEGGRFLHAENRYVVVDVGSDDIGPLPSTFAWVTVGQLLELVGHGYYLNVELRTLLASVHCWS